MLQNSFGMPNRQQAKSMPLHDQLEALHQAFTPDNPVMAPSSGHFETVQLARMVMNYRWVIVACLLLGLAGGVLYTKIQRPMYQSTSKVEIITSSAKVLRELEVSSEANDLVVFETARQRILSRDVAERVVERLNLAFDPLFLAEIPKFSLSHIFRDPLSNAHQKDLTTISEDARREDAIAIVRRNLSARLLRNTSILAVTFEHPSPAYARAVANAVSSAYVGLTVDRKLDISRQAREILEQQAALAKSELEKSEKALVDYADAQGLTVVGDNSNLIAGNINEINKLLAHAVNERLLAERYHLQLTKNGAASLPQSFESNTVQAAKDKLIDLKAEYQQKLATLKPGFPTMRKLRSQISDVERSLKGEIRAIGQGIKIQLDQARRKEESLRLELSKLEDQKRNYQRKNIRYTILRREADSNRAHYQSLIKKLSDVGVGASLNTATASVVDAAELPLSRSSPRLLFNLLGALTIVSLLGAFLVYAREILNDGFNDPDHLTRDLDLPVAGVIPHVPVMGKADGWKACADNGADEAYRILRTTLQHARSQNRIKTLLVTSTAQGEGKSVTARHLAEDFARLGEKVLLLDADLRQPGLQSANGPGGKAGFANMLNNTVAPEELHDCFKETHLDNLTVLPAGHVISNPSDLLASRTLPRLLGYFSKTYDLVVIDSSPVAGFADTLLVSRESDATLFVVASGQEERSAIRSVLARLQMTGGKVMGTVLTKFQPGWLKNGFERRCGDTLNSQWQEFRQARMTRPSPAPAFKEARPAAATSSEINNRHEQAA